MGQAFRERLAESTPSAKLMVRGRASRSRRRSDVTTIKTIAKQNFNAYQIMRGHTKSYERVPNDTTRTN